VKKWRFFRHDNMCEASYGKREMELQHPFFRAKAMQEYIQRQEKDILPRFLSPYVTILSYFLLFLLLLLGAFAWWGEAPLFVSGPGVVLTAGAAGTMDMPGTEVVLFFPVQAASHLHAGEEADLSVEPAGRPFRGTIKNIEAGTLSPDEARQRYMLNGMVARLLPGSLVAAYILPAADAPHLEPGDMVSAQVHAGSQHVLLLLQEAATGR
jgi:hypothetical protein